MKKIICFGDSNTRWTGLLAKNLGSEFEIIEEGCNNRTGFFQNPDGHLQSGQKYLPECLKKHSDFDTIILAVGTNDLQKTFKIDESIALDGLKNLIAIIREANKNARIIVIPPVILNNKILQGYFSCQFDETSVNASVWIQRVYEVIVQKSNCELLDLNQYVKPSDFDGLHFDKEFHKIIAETVANQLSKLKIEVSY